MTRNAFQEYSDPYSDPDATQYANFAGDNVEPYREFGHAPVWDADVVGPKHVENHGLGSLTTLAGLGALTTVLLAIFVCVVVNFAQKDEARPSDATKSIPSTTTAESAAGSGGTHTVTVAPTTTVAPPATMTNPVQPPTVTVTVAPPATMTNPVQPPTVTRTVAPPATMTNPLEPPPATMTNPLEPPPATMTNPLEPPPATMTNPLELPPATMTNPVDSDAELPVIYGD